MVSTAHVWHQWRCRKRVVNVPGNAGREAESGEGRGCQRDHGVVEG